MGAPSASPTTQSNDETEQPMESPTPEPTKAPSASPTTQSNDETEQPMESPTPEPTKAPSASPTTQSNDPACEDVKKFIWKVKSNGKTTRKKCKWVVKQLKKKENFCKKKTQEGIK